MRHKTAMAIVIFLLGAGAGWAAEGDKYYDPASKVCGLLSETCEHVPINVVETDLPFDLREVIKEEDVSNYKYFYTEPFYMVILESKPIVRSNHGLECNEGYTQERLAEVQKNFKENRVFSSGFACTSRITYTQTNSHDNFMLAVYAGKTKEEATAFFATAKKMNKWPTANLRRTQIGLHFGCMH